MPIIASLERVKHRIETRVINLIRLGSFVEDASIKRSSYKVVRRSNCMDITCEMQVELEQVSQLVERQAIYRVRYRTSSIGIT